MKIREQKPMQVGTTYHQIQKPETEIRSAMLLKPVLKLRIQNKKIKQKKRETDIQNYTENFFHLFQQNKCENLSFDSFRYRS